MNQSSAGSRVPSYLISLSIAGVTFFGLLSCSSAPDSPDSSTPESNQEATASSEGSAASSYSKTSSSEYQSRLKKAEQDLSEAERANRKKANTLYDKARTLLDKGEYEQALEETNKALDYDPTHEQAEQLKDTLLSLMGEQQSPSANLDNLQNRLDAKLEQNIVQIETGLEDARQMMENQEYSRARKKLLTLETRLKGAEWMDSDKFDNYRSQVKSLLNKTTVKARQQEESIQQKLRAKSQQQAVEAEKQERMQEIRWTDRMMSQAVLHFKQEDYEQTINITDEILSRFPNFQVAKDLKRDAQKAQAGQFERDLRARKAEQWKNFQERMMEKRIPQSEILKFPSEEHWEMVNQRSSQQEPISAIKEGGEQQTPLFSLRNKLKSESTTLEFASSDLENVLDVVRKKHDLNIVVDGDAETQANKKRSIFLKDLRLTNALSLITNKYGLRYDLREDTVFVTTPANVRPQTELQVFKTRDLVYLLKDVKDFGSKQVGGLTTSNESDGASLDDIQMSHSDDKNGSSSSYPYQEDSDTSQDDSSTKKQDKKEVDLAGMIKEHVNPDSWNHENTGIRQSYNGMLFVQNTPEVLANVERFVDDLRSFAGSMVNVSVHFLSVRDEFLKHFGVEFKEAQSQAASPFFNTQPSVAGQSGNTSPPGPGVDDNFLSNFSTRESQPASPLSTIENQGGLGLTYQNLSGTDYQAVLRALQRDDRSYILDSTQFTLFNTQRANITAGQQKAFIQDYEVQPSGSASSFNPQIGVIGTGLLLDVRPIISFDRRYVTLQLLPSLTSDVTFDTQSILEIGGFPLTVQLPRLQKKSVSTTVRLPDNGSLLLGGLTRSETLNKTQGIPVLESMPILGALFKESVRRDVGREIRILVKVEILNTAEEQQEAYGATSTTGLQSDN